MQQLFLRNHAFMCYDHGHCVVLDLECDKYVSLERSVFDRLQPWLAGCESAITANPGAAYGPPPDIAAVASELMARDLFATSSIGAKLAVPVSVDRVAHSLSWQPRNSAGLHCWRHAMAFAAGASRAHLALRHRPIRRVVAFVERRKRRAGSGDFDFTAAGELVRAFEALRWFFPRQYLCLFDSLALLNFLAVHHVFPTWVFGVRADPFEAHCWVQQGAVLLNDTVERVRRFTPIMAV